MADDQKPLRRPGSEPHPNSLLGQYRRMQRKAVAALVRRDLERRRAAKKKDDNG